MAEFVSRIPSEELEQCNDWSLPDVTSKHAVSTVKYQSKRQMGLHSQATTSAVSQSSKTQEKHTEPHEKDDAQEVVESVEDVNLDDVTPEPMTAETLNKITEDAHKEGFDKGYEEGFEKSQEEGRIQGVQDGEAEIKEKVQQLDHLIQAIQNPLEKEYEVLQQQLLDIICHLTRSVTERDLQIESSIIEKVVKQSLELLTPEPKKIIIRLNEKDKSQVEELLSTQELPVHYETDSEIMPGGCRIDTANTHIDLSMNTRLDEILDNFLEQRYSQSTHKINDDVDQDNNTNEEIKSEKPSKDKLENDGVDNNETSVLEKDNPSEEDEE